MNKITYDLDRNGKFTEGYLEFSDGKITRTENGETAVFPVCDCSELFLTPLIGCCTLELVPKNAENNDNNSFLCRFSMSCKNETGEFCKVVNHFIDTGEELEADMDVSGVCPHCGRKYMDGMSVCMFCEKKTGLIKRVIETLGKYRTPFILSVIFVLLSDIASAIIPTLNSELVDGYLYDTTSARADIVRGIAITAVLMGVCQLFKIAFSIISKRQAAIVSTGFAHELRKNVYEKMQRMSLTALSKRTPGDLMKRVDSDTNEVRDFLSDEGLRAVEQILMFIVIVAILCYTNVKLTIVALLPVPVGLLIFRFFREKMHIRYGRQWRSESRLNSLLHDTIKGIKVVKNYGTEEKETERFSKAAAVVRDVGMSNERWWALTQPYIMFIIGCGEYLVLWFGGKMALDGTLTAGELLRFTLYLTYLYTPINWFSRLPMKIARMTTSMAKVFEIIDEPDSMALTGEKTAEFENSIDYKNTRFGYKPYDPVLKDINLHIKKGETIGLVGHSGAGKSTMINLLMRLYDANSGSLELDGENVKDFTAESYRGLIATVFQEQFLFAGSVMENIAYAKPEATAEEVMAAAKLANAHDFIMKLPDGYNTNIGENGHRLSGGEKQRLSIARAVLRNPEILILDEATSALDTETEKNIREALDRVTENRTTVAIAHRLSTLAGADRLIVIDNGKIAETGTHDELIQKGGIYAHLVEAQRETARLR